MAVTLYGYHLSVYRRVARMALVEKGVAYDTVEVNPFADDCPGWYLDLQPFRRVPTLDHDGFVLYETGAITRYVDEAFDGPPLQPGAPQARARMAQVISVVDSYVYWPLVRQVFSHGAFRPSLGIASDQAELAAGLARAPLCLAALEALAGAETWLVGDTPTLADLHLAPMIGYFVMHPLAATMLGTYPRLSAWWAAMQRRPSFAATRPELPARQDTDAP